MPPERITIRPPSGPSPPLTRDGLREELQESLRRELAGIEDQLRKGLQQELRQFLQVFEVWSGSLTRAPSYSACTPLPGNSLSGFISGQTPVAQEGASGCTPTPNGCTPTTIAEQTRRVVPPAPLSASAIAPAPPMPWMLSLPTPPWMNPTTGQLENSHEWTVRPMRGFRATETTRRHARTPSKRKQNDLQKRIGPSDKADKWNKRLFSTTSAVNRQQDAPDHQADQTWATKVSSDLRWETEQPPIAPQVPATDEGDNRQGEEQVQAFNPPPEDNPGEKPSGAASSVPRFPMSTRLARVVDSHYFDYGAGCVVLLNAAVIGVQTEYMCRNRSEPSPPGFNAPEIFFFVLFAAELILRMMTYGRDYLLGEGWQFNMFDMLVVVAQCLEIILRIIEPRHTTLNFVFTRVIRLLWMIRIVRTARVLHLIGELRTMTSCVICSLQCLFWTAVLLLLVVYIAAVVFTQIVSIYLENNQDEELERYFGTLGSSVFVLFQSFTGGVDWRDVTTPLVNKISVIMGPVFMLYISFMLFAVLNIVTGVFVETALRNAKDDKDYFMINNVRELLINTEGDKKGYLRWSDFESQLDSLQMKEYFKAIDVDLSEARNLYTLLDRDKTDHVDAEEFFKGCLDLRGPAKALDLALLMHEVRVIGKRLATHVRSTENRGAGEAPHSEISAE